METTEAHRAAEELSAAIEVFERLRALTVDHQETSIQLEAARGRARQHLEDAARAYVAAPRLA